MPQTFGNAGFGSLNPVGTGGSGGLDINALLQQLGIGGATGFWPAVGLQAGGALFSGLSGLLQGETDAQKQAQSVSNLAENRLGQSYIDEDQYMAQYIRSLSPMFNQQAAGAAQRVGLDSGAAQGEMMRFQQPIIAGAQADIQKFGAGLTQQNDMNMMQLLAQLSQYV